MMPVDRLLGVLLSGSFGAAIGSWLNVVILRSHADRPWWQGRSACPHCGTTLQWFELVPVVSFVLLGGRCRHCRRTLTRQYLIVEVLTAASFAVIWMELGTTALMLAGLIMTAAMILIAVYDARWSLIPDSFSLFFIASSIVVALLGQLTWTDMLLGGLAGFTVFAVQHWLSRRRWVGSGDIFLGVGLGLLLGWRHLFLSLFLAYMAGAIVAGALILSRRLTAKSTMPFGPYLMAGGFATWLWGELIIDWYFGHALFM